MTRNGSIVKIVLVGIIALLLGWSITLAVGTKPTQADTELPPLVAHMPVDITSQTIPTPTLPSRLKLVAPAFMLEVPRHPLTLTVDTTKFADSTSHLHLVYQADPQAKWRLVYAAHNTHRVQPITIPGTGIYAWVWLTPAAAPPPPSGAIVVDDVTPGFVTYTHSTPQYWHIAIEGGDYYGGHTHWTRNTQTVTTTENWATWQPSTPLTGPYAVWVYVPNDYATTEHARYVVSHAGISTTVEIDQNAIYPDAAWVRLGAFHFISDTASYVLLTDTTGEPYDSHWIAFDAVAFVPQTIYLPLVTRHWPPPPQLKIRSGVHLGNRPLIDWNQTSTGTAFDFLAELRGQEQGIYPSALVVQSNQIYNIERNGPGCTVSGASVKSQSAFDLMIKAAQAGTQIIIRIKPSPGNFEDAVWITQTHAIIPWSGITPQSRDYCTDPIPGGDGGRWAAPDYFRAIDDIAKEMHYIHELNLNYGFVEAGFEPANEPNKEWYSDWHNPEVETQIKQPTGWVVMDAYFSALYDYVHSDYPGINAFTPPMSQSNLAERFNMAACKPMTVSQELSGYDFMQATYTTKNDGYSWHNYWAQSKEFWGDSDDPNILCLTSYHVFQYFPEWLQSEIVSSGKPAFITEADLFSPCQVDNNPIQDKYSQSAATQESLWRFVSEEQGADHIMAWLLTESPHFPQGCAPGIPLSNYEEIKWHEAYTEDGASRQWFEAWWEHSE